MLDRVEGAAERVISSVSLLEAGIVIRARLGAAAVPVLYQLVEELGTVVVPFVGLRARAAIDRSGPLNDFFPIRGLAEL